MYCLNTVKIITMTALATAFAMVLSSEAFAQTKLTCMSLDQDTEIEITFNEAAVLSGPLSLGHAKSMAIKNLNRRPESQTVASFHADEGVLVNQANHHLVAIVDLSNPKSSKARSRIAGTVLGAIQAIELKVDLAYRKPGQSREIYWAEAIFTKHDGLVFAQDFECVR
jgi:hypothetical protein